MLLPVLLLLVYSCKKSVTSTDAQKPYATFTIGSAKQSYNSGGKLSGQLCDASAWCSSFYFDADNSEYKLLHFGFPETPVPTHIYKTGDLRFDVYFLNDQGVRYSLSTAIFQVQFSVWEGAGGWGKATFSGWLKSTAGDSIQLSNGYFQGKIESITTKNENSGLTKIRD